MDIDVEVSASETPDYDLAKDGGDNGDYEIKALETYLASVPYECEAIPVMHAKLRWIVSRFLVCLKTREWMGVNVYDQLLHCWLNLRYPLPKHLRISLVKLYYELILVPGMDARLVRSWADMLVKLIGSKGPGTKRKLLLKDLQLEWWPLWNVLFKDLFPKKRGAEESRNMVNILLYVADQCKVYYPPTEIETMLSTFLGLMTRDSYLSIVHVLASFLPLRNFHAYMPTLFKLWEALNSNVVDERMLEVMGNLAVEYGAAMDDDESYENQWRDIGIYTTAQWTVLMGKCLGSFNIPVGPTRGASTTGTHADSQADAQSLRIKKNTNRYNHLSQIFVYSMSVDGPIREVSSNGSSGGDFEKEETRYLAGSKALDSLERLVTSTETYFHPSNAGAWTLCLTTFLHRICVEFCKRWKEEEDVRCRTPLTHRLTPGIKHHFVSILRTPALLAMFSKDPVSMSFAQGALRILALLEPNLVMPEVLARAYGGLESINETHRTTAALSTLSGVALPLVSEQLWLGGQKHLLPLLELSLPGIDLNDPAKTICTTMFLIATLQYVKIADLTQYARSSGAVAAGEGTGDIVMNDDGERLPDGVEDDGQGLSREQERTLVKESTAGFADWVVKFFRRIFELYENLPEEGGKRNVTGGKQEEAVLKALKNALNIVCLHLSDPLFDFILSQTYEYAVSNAKSNAVRAFGGLVGCLARVQPDKTIKKFLPHCISNIELELKHGASSIRTTSTHGAVPSDTTLHWNLSILRGCLGYGGPALLEYKDQIIELVKLLVDKTYSERGYTSTGRLIARILNTVTGIYPQSGRFVNTDEWEDPDFNSDNFLHWGKLYAAKEVKVEWHVPSEDEITFTMEFLEGIIQPALSKVEELLVKPKSTWDSVWRNDFCRYLHAVRSAWSGLPTIVLEREKEVVNPCLIEGCEIPEFLATSLQVAAGFTLTDPADKRYQKIVKFRRHFGTVLHAAAEALQESGKEDHIDATLAVSRGIDVYLLEYGVSQNTFTALEKGYFVVRDLQRLWAKSKHFSRLVILKRAQIYHTRRVYLNSMFRQRDSLDDDLFRDLVELSMSTYTRVRRNAQSVWLAAIQQYVRSTRLSLPYILNSLKKDTDPDRMKGALYLLSNKVPASYVISDRQYAGAFINAILGCQHQEKPSIQKLVSHTMAEATSALTSEFLSTHVYTAYLSRLPDAVKDLQSEFDLPDEELDSLDRAMATLPTRVQQKDESYSQMISSILEVGNSATTHWKYAQAAARFLFKMIRRDSTPSASMARFFINNALSDHPSLRTTCLRAIVKILWIVKIRSWSKSIDELWLDTWKNPLSVDVPITNPQSFMQDLATPLENTKYLVDKVMTGFFVWNDRVKAYAPPDEHTSMMQWDASCVPVLEEIKAALDRDEWFPRLITLWTQESSSAANGLTDVRVEHLMFIKSLFKMFQDRHLDMALNVIEPLWQDSDRFKQRAAAEILQGMLRGSKHWPTSASSRLWAWIVPRLQRILTSITPDTVQIWESVFSRQLRNWDPRRNGPLIDFIASLHIEFAGASPFLMSKSINLIGIMAYCLDQRFEPYADRYAQLFFDNADTGYAEIRGHIAANLDTIVKIQWHPSYRNIGDLLHAVATTTDPLQIRDIKHRDRIDRFVEKFPDWRQKRLPPPNQAQSQYDKVGLTFLLFIWTGAHGPFAPTIFAYTAPLLPSFLEMAELNDSSDLQRYSSAVLYVLSAVVPPPEYVETVAGLFTDAIVNSTSWRVRLNALPTLAVFWYRNLASFTEEAMSKLIDVLLQCLEDENLEVREMAAKTLSSVLRSSQRHRILPLRERFVRTVRQTRLPRRRDAQYNESLRKLHAGILGIVALIDAHPYNVTPWMPSLCEDLAPHASDPPPIAQTIRRCAADFKKTHQDMWHIDQYQFNDDQLQALSTMVSGNSYYA